MHLKIQWNLKDHRLYGIGSKGMIKIQVKMYISGYITLMPSGSSVLCFFNDWLYTVMYYTYREDVLAFGSVSCMIIGIFCN